MARSLVIKRTERVEHPDDPELWFSIKLPLSVGDLEQMRTEGGGIAVSIDLAERVIEAWCYDEPVSHDAIRRMPIDDFVWLQEQIVGLSGIRSEEEKKGSNASSPPTTAPAAAPSLLSSGT